MLDNEKKTLSEYRLIRAEELIADAEKLFESGSFKSANNRAYYSIFASMRAVIALEGVDFKKHSGVIQYFQRKHIKTGHFDKQYSNIIMNASTVRNASDYDDFYIASKEETKQQIEDAKAFLKAVREFLENA